MVRQTQHFPHTTTTLTLKARQNWLRKLEKVNAVSQTGLSVDDVRIVSGYPRLSELPDEVANTLTHGLGLLLSILALVILCGTVLQSSPYWITVSCITYGLSLISVYGASTLSHSIQQPKWKELWQAIDQAVIYLHIPAASTPFLLVYSCDHHWWLLVPFMWLVAIIGFAAKILFPHQLCYLSLASYLLLGWIPLIALAHAAGSLAEIALVFALLGGCSYTIGTYFLMNDHKAWYYHAIWHLFVIAGSTLHFYTNCAYVIPTGLDTWASSPLL